MNKKLVLRNIALMLVFIAIGLTEFTENVRTVQVLGLFVCGMGFGSLLTSLLSAFKIKAGKDNS